MKNPPWTRDEHLLALDFYLSHAPSIPAKDSREVLELSGVLNQLHSYLEHEKNENFRNANGVYMKLMNFRRLDPAYAGVGLANGNKDEQIVWDLYAEKRNELSQIASKIKAVAGNQREALPVIPPDEEEGNEGQILSRVHRFRERDRTLVAKKKSKFLQDHARVFCEACGFDFENKYGERGKDFIECHHTRPVSEIGLGEVTRLTDLILLCSNCHRMIHRQKPWLSVQGLQEILTRREYLSRQEVRHDIK